MDSVYFHAFLVQQTFQSLSLLERTTEANPAVRTEVAGNRDEFYGEAVLSGFLFGADRMVNGRKEDDSVRHD